MGILTFQRTSQAGKWDTFESRSGSLALEDSQRFVVLLFSEINPQVASAFIRALNFDRRERKPGKMSDVVAPSSHTCATVVFTEASPTPQGDVRLFWDCSV